MNKFTEFFHAIEERIANAFERILDAWIRLMQVRTQSKIDRTRARAEAKAVEIEAKANAEYVKAQAKLVDEQRKLARKQFRGLWAPLAFAVLTAAFGLATLLGIALHVTWMWTLFPWLMIISTRFRGFAKRGQLSRQNIGRILLPRLSTAWIGTWLIFTIARLWR